MENKPMISETEKREALKQFMAEKAKAPVCVAFSGGVDSSLILKLACAFNLPSASKSSFCKKRSKRYP